MFSIGIVIVLVIVFVDLGECCDVYINTGSYDSFVGLVDDDDHESGLKGHYSSSISLPLSISTVITRKELVERKLMIEYSLLCLYGSHASKVLENLVNRGVWERENLKVIEDESFMSYSSSEQIKRIHTEYLVSAKWVHEHIDDLLIIHISEGPLQPIYTEFIEGTVHISSDLFETEPEFNVHPCEVLSPVFQSYGISKDRLILLYGGEGADTGTPILGVTRIFMVLKNCGINNIRIMNGGIQSWKDYGFPISDKCVTPKPSDDSNIQSFVSRDSENDKYFVDHSHIMKYLNNKPLFGTSQNIDQVFLFDCRSLDEFQGKDTGYPFVGRKGRIPNSIFLGQDFLALDGHTLRPFNEIESILREKMNLSSSSSLEIEMKRKNVLIFYCGTGWRASVMWFITKYLIGWENCYVYDGGWNEWHRNPKNPIVVEEEVQEEVILEYDVSL